MTNPELGKKVRILPHTGCSKDEGKFIQGRRSTDIDAINGYKLILVCAHCGNAGMIEDHANPLTEKNN